MRMTFFGLVVGGCDPFLGRCDLFLGGCDLFWVGVTLFWVSLGGCTVYTKPSIIEIDCEAIWTCITIYKNKINIILPFRTRINIYLLFLINLRKKIVMVTILL